MNMQVAIVGTGAVGEHLALGLKNAGYQVSCIISRSPKAASKLAGKVDAKFSIQLGNKLPDGIDLLFLCVPDDAISGTAARLSGISYNWSGVCVAHTSGALTAQVLKPFSLLKASVLSFHPVQTFKKGHAASWEGTFVGIEGDEKGLQVGEEIAVSLGSVPLRLGAEDKVLYHASAVFASNFLVAVVDIASTILNELNLDTSDAMKLLGPLIANTCENVLASNPGNALTGPASRGDIDTIKKHAKALKDSVPEIYDLYLELTRVAVELKNKVDPAFTEKAQAVHREIDRLSAK